MYEGYIVEGTCDHLRAKRSWLSNTLNIECEQGTLKYKECSRIGFIYQQNN